MTNLLLLELRNEKSADMKLKDFGYKDEIERARIDLFLKDFDIGRVVSEHKERYVVWTERGEFEAEVTGSLRFSARSREDFPAVGDWVALTIFDPDFSVIHKILPRFSTVSRQAVGRFGDIQIMATNVDYAFVIQAVDRDFNANRLERYLTICFSSKVCPIVVLTKTDLIDEDRLAEIMNVVKQRIVNIPIVGTSNQTQDGYEVLKKNLIRGKTYCLLGSSGVGKSTLINNLSGRMAMNTHFVQKLQIQRLYPRSRGGLFGACRC